MLNRRTLFLVIALPAVLGLSAESSAAVRTVALTDVATALAIARPGDVIRVSDGVYDGVTLRWTASGTAERPVTVEAATQGGVVVTGKSSLQLSGEGLTVSGLTFRGVVPQRRSVVEFAIGNRYANHSRLTECVIDSCNTRQRDETRSYIVLSGRNNRVDHCTLTGKLNLGVTLLVNLNGEGCLDNRHQIDHNLFGERGVYGSNGAETIRIGTSQQSMMSSRTVVEDNLFHRCSGEVEIISVKSCDNIVRRNTFVECQGVVALRHGLRNTVEDNLFLGNGVRNTGGVRIVDGGHRVVRNTMVGLAGERFFSALGVMSGVPNSLPNRYVRAHDTVIEDNTFIDCRSLEIGTGLDEERTEPPSGIVFRNNRIGNPCANVPLTILDSLAGVVAEGNIVSLAKPYDSTGYRTGKVKVPQTALKKVTFTGAKGHVYDPQRSPLRSVNATFTAGSADGLPSAVSQAAPGDTVLLTSADYVLTSPIVIEKPLVIKAADRSVVRYAGDEAAEVIRIADGGSLHAIGLVFDGTLTPGRRLATAGISTAPQMSRTYTLRVSQCEFRNFGESTFCAIRGTKGTMADSVVIENTLFCDNSGNGIDFSAERDDRGRYNAEDVAIRQCEFRNFLGMPVNIYRGGSDESTAGPYVSVTSCVFEDCCNRQRGSVMRLIGPQHLDIAGCTFVNSGRGGASVRLDETSWERIAVHGCVFRQSGRIMTSTDNVKMYDNKYEK